MRNTAQTREEVKSRMLHHISSLWGIKNTDSLDPLVRVLVEALSGELNKTQQEIYAFEKRILAKIALLFTPGLLSSPYCAHGIVHAQSSESECIINSTTSFYLKKKIAGNDGGIDLYFTPSCKTSLSDAGIKYLGTASKVYEFDAIKQKTLFLTGKSNINDHQDIWLGIQAGKGFQTLDGVHFYFDFLNTDEKRHLFATIRNAIWKTGKRELKVEKGIRVKSDTEKVAGIFDAFDPMLQIENEVTHFYGEHFVTISDQATEITEEEKCFYPDQFKDNFTQAELGKFTSKLFWINIRPTSYMEEKTLFALFVSMNSFPVLNRRMKDIVHRAKGLSSILPIVTEPYEYFLSVKELSDSRGKVYNHIPGQETEGQIQGTYAVRKGGTEKMDSRTAKEYLQNLVEIIRDEYAAFSSFGQDTVGSLLNDLDKILVQIEQRIKQNKSFNLDSASYVSIESLNQNDIIFLQYWITNANSATDIHPGTKLKPEKGVEVKADSVVLLSGITGGKKALEPERHIGAFKYALLTHNRLMTAEDLKAFCSHELGDKIEKAEIRKGFIASKNPKEGFVKCVEVLLTRKPETKTISEQEWTSLLAETQSKMEMRSALNMSLRLVLV